MTLDNMTFLGEEIILHAEKVEKENKEFDAFLSSNMPHEKEMYGRFRVVKTGKNQTELKEGDYVLVNKNGLPKEITIEGVGIIKDTFALPTSQRIFCKLNE